MPIYEKKYALEETWRDSLDNQDVHLDLYSWSWIIQAKTPKGS